jgi:hypothetical protein
MIRNRSQATLPALALALATGQALCADTVEVTPKGRILFAGSGTPCPFHAEVKGAAQQPAWIWTVELLNGGVRPAQGGSITAEGVYVPPAWIHRTRIFRIRATAADGSGLTGTTRVRIELPVGMAAVETHVMGGFGYSLQFGPRIEHLAGAAQAGGEMPVLTDVQSAPLLPWKDAKGPLADAWLVCDQKGGIRAVSAGGAVQVLHKPDSIRSFRRLAVKPWHGAGDDPWACFLSTLDFRIWRMDASGELTPVNLPGVTFKHYPAMTAAPDGSLYLSYMRFEDRNDGSVQPSQGMFRSVILRVAPDGRMTTVAGRFEFSPDSMPWDDSGPGGVLGRLEDLALDPGTGRLLVLEARPRDQREQDLVLRVVDPKDGSIRTLPAGMPAPRLGTDWRLSWFHGRVVVVDTLHQDFYLVDPAAETKAVQIYRNPMGPFTPGPVDPAAEAKHPGRLGAFLRGYAIGADGRICVTANKELGLLFLEWEAYGIRSEGGGTKGDGKAARQTKSPVETKGDSKAGEPK